MATDKYPDIIVGRELSTQQVHFFRLNLTYSSKKRPVYIGTLPKNSIILSCSVYTKTAFNDTKVQIGTSSDAKSICELEVKQVGVKSHTFTEDKMFVSKTKEMEIYATLDKDNLASGEAVLVIEFVPDR